ncbi:hypothetical protein [Amycolatopsis sp.]|uniref:hypothetical protein n=1 Tax=Amycolatopsis sp. TaxID=37632 RepID=UPI002B97CB96|nr:hypothetical protein [Amycolatopsis sp.]HVV11898.1 hypothetical protein [Amycolatopsis sp.]
MTEARDLAYRMYEAFNGNNFDAAGEIFAVFSAEEFTFMEIFRVADGRIAERRGVTPQSAADAVRAAAGS